MEIQENIYFVWKKDCNRIILLSRKNHYLSRKRINYIMDTKWILWIKVWKINIISFISVWSKIIWNIYSLINYYVNIRGGLTKIQLLQIYNFNINFIGLF